MYFWSLLRSTRSAWRSMRSAFACELFAPYLLISTGQLRLVLIDVTLVLVAIGAVLVQVAAIVVDVALVLIAIFAIGRQVTLIFVDVALIGVVVRAVLREIFLVVSNVLLVIFDVLRLRTRILALGINATREQTGKGNCEHTSTHHSFCVHFLVSLVDRSGTNPMLRNQTLRAQQSFAGRLSSMYM